MAGAAGAAVGVLVEAVAVGVLVAVGVGVDGVRGAVNEEEAEAGVEFVVCGEVGD